MGLRALGELANDENRARPTRQAGGNAESGRAHYASWYDARDVRILQGSSLQDATLGARRERRRPLAHHSSTRSSGRCTGEGTQLIRRTPLKRSTKRIPTRRAKPRRGPAGIPAEEWRNAAYRQFLREEGKCIVPGCITHFGRMTFRASPDAWPFVIDPMHGPPNGRGSKGPDAGCIPGCRAHHEEQTKTGWPAFEKKYGFNREREAAVWFAAFKIWKESQ